MRSTSLVLLAVPLMLLALNRGAIAAEDPATDSTGSEAKRVLTPEELAEKDARKACKKKICDIIASRDPTGEDVSCDIVKTWREDDIVKMLGGKISWRWGKAVCQSRLEVKRTDLALAMSAPDYDMVMPEQKVRSRSPSKTVAPLMPSRSRSRRQRHSRTARPPKPASIGARPPRRLSSIR
jgi:hypothetical protein